MKKKKLFLNFMKSFSKFEKKNLRNFKKKVNFFFQIFKSLKRFYKNSGILFLFIILKSEFFIYLFFQIFKI